LVNFAGFTGFFNWRDWPEKCLMAKAGIFSGLDFTQEATTIL
jgi:hypothetical protein